MRNQKTSVVRLAGCVALIAALGLAAGEALADDTALFSTRVPPNVMIVLDNSGSMSNVVWHPAFRIDAAYTGGVCPVLEPDHPDYMKCLPHPTCDLVFQDSRMNVGDVSWQSLDKALQTTNGVDTSEYDLSASTDCVERDIFPAPGNVAVPRTTRWQIRYLNWFLSKNVEEDHDGDGRTILEEMLDTDDGVRNACVLANEPSLSANYPLYIRSRMEASQETLKDVICRTNEIADLRFGLATFENEGDPEGAFVLVPPDSYANNASDLTTELNSLRPTGNTPIAESIYYIYRFFMSRIESERPFGKSGSGDRFPVYDYDLDGDEISIPPDTPPPHPVTHDCQKHFIILVTDGEPTRDDFDDMDRTQFQDLIGDYYDPGDEDELPPNVVFAPVIDGDSCGGDGSATEDSCEISLYLDDIAAFMKQKDFFPTTGFPSDQTIDLYTVGFSTSGGANAYLSRSATRGGGQFFAGNSAEELGAGLIASLADIIDKSFSFTAATVPASRATDGNNFFATYFRPSGTSPYWEGHLKAFEFNAAGEIRDKPVPPATSGECAVDDPLVPARCLVGRLKVELDGYWDAADGIPAPGSRNLYVSLNESTRPTPNPPTASDAFDTSLTTAQLDFSGLGLGIGDLSDFDVVGDTSDIDDDDELKDAIVEYLMGCEFDDDASACIDRGDGNKLWDLFHSNPVVVGPPNAGLSEETYRVFVDKYKHRKRVIVGGSNGGFVHGFNAGEYDNTLTDAYDRGDGSEEWAFMPWWARKKIADLPRTVTPKLLTVDGSPVASDVWLYPAYNVQPDAGTWKDWRTVLMGGMREGGRVYYALDVTNPPDHDSLLGEQAPPAGPANYPGYLWEFPCESTAAECIGTDVVPTGRSYLEYMGETWSEPVITRVRVRLADTCVPDPCPTYDRWVAIFGAGYDTKGDPNHPDYDGGFLASTSRAGRAVFMVDITTGEVLAWRRFDHEITDPDLAMRYAFAASPAVFDLNRDGYADVAYFGDLGGNVWKWVLSDDVVDPINGTETDERHLVSPPSDVDGWKFFKFFQADDCSPIEGCVPAHHRSFFFPPAGALVGAKLYLVFGSGERNHLDYVSTIDEEKNRLYVVHDADPLERETALPLTAFTPRYTDANLIPAGSMPGSCIPPTGKVGFYIDAEHGEKFVTNVEIFFGLVLTGSFKPSTGGSTCDNAGQGFLYGFDLFCGTGALPDPGGGGGSVARVSVGSGLPSRPRVSVGPVGDDGGGGGDCKDMVVVITSEGEAFSDCPGGRPDSGVSVKSWRDDN